MAIREKEVKVIGGAGGPNNNAIPVYGDDKAPTGNHLTVNGKQLMLPNDYELVMVDRVQFLPGVDKGNFFNSRGYARVWQYNSETGHGDDIVPGQEAWVEESHLQAIWDEPKEDDPGEAVSFEQAGEALGTLLAFIKQKLA